MSAKEQIWKVTIKGFIFMVTGTYMYDPGRMYYPDGSGQPPSWEIEYTKITYKEADVTQLMGELHWWKHGIKNGEAVVESLENEIINLEQKQGNG